MKNKLVFFGTEDFSLPYLETLLNKYNVCLVVTKPDAGRGRKSKPMPPAVKVLAEKADIEVFQPAKFDDEALSKLSSTGARAAILASYGKILPMSVLSAFPIGIINIHPSLLPDKRGPSPIEATILEGDTRSGVSLMKLSEMMDAGPLYAQSDFAVTKNVTKADLTNQLIKCGTKLLINNLEKILSKELEPKPQDDTKATYTSLIHKSDGQIDWNLPAQQVERHVRAYMGWPGSYTDVFGVRITILSVEISDKDGPAGEQINVEDKLGFYCGQGSLIINELQPAGGRPMPSDDFLRGYAT